MGSHPAVGCNGFMIQPLEILPYDPSWALEFQAEREGIARALGKIALRIEHSGSTAVPGLAAKAVIDIQVSVEHLRPIPAYAEPLATVGYVHEPHADDSFCPFFHRPGNGHTPITSMLLSSVAKKSGARWHSATSCGSTGMWYRNILCSRSSWQL